jgi:hypothetical protein
LLHPVCCFRIDQRPTNHSPSQAAYENRRVEARAQGDLGNTDGIDTGV